MTKTPVVLESVDQVREFVNIITAYDCDFDLESGRYLIDAKSIMGIFSLDLSKSTTLIIHSEDKKQTDDILKALAEYIGK